MPKRATAPKTTDEFIRWCQALLPSGVSLSASAWFSYRRDDGYVQQSYELHLDVRKDGHRMTQQSHDFRVLANWLVDVALPTLCPPPERVLRKITVVRPALTHRPDPTLSDL